MLKIQKVRWKNFMSYGNNFSEIDFEKYDKLCISGSNGKGKSSLIEALFFGLFGKSYRKINKPQLVNSINQKDLVVEVYLTTNGNNYKIVRGIKKNIFEVYENDILIDQSSTNPDYQRVLEDNILKTNFDSFKQVAVLSTDREQYIPFMELPTDKRRKFIEVLLGIEFIQEMNSLVKKDQEEVSQQIENIVRELQYLDKEYINQIKYIEDIKTYQDNDILSIHSEIIENQSKLNDYEKDLSDMNDMMIQMQNNINNLNVKLQEYNSDAMSAYSDIISNNNLIKSIEKSIRFINENSECPSCKQEIGLSHRKHICFESNEKIKELKDEISIIENAKAKIDKKIENINKKQKEFNDFLNDINELKSKISNIRKNIQFLKNRLDTKPKTVDDSYYQKLEEIKNNINRLNTEKTELQEKLNIIEFSLLILKDNGVKAEIVKKYLPIFNKKINEYLAEFNFFVDFSLDESFSEVVHSISRESFTYRSFSAGQKKRIDIAILLACLDICRMRSNLHTNVIFFDEIMDFGFDQSGIDDFIKIVNNISKEKNVIIISPRGDLYIDKFSNVLNVEMEQGFSIIK